MRIKALQLTRPELQPNSRALGVARHTSNNFNRRAAQLSARSVG
jgi:hypothetical protein